MMYVFMLPGALGALAGPAMQGIASGQVGASQQGELQGGLSSIASLTSIISPLVMTHSFSYFVSAEAPVYLPGAAFLLAALLTVASLLLFVRTTRGLVPSGEGARL
jgi:MFS transporter, DHA1 family, tetracycline resistance protein